MRQWTRRPALVGNVDNGQLQYCKALRDMPYYVSRTPDSLETDSHRPPFSPITHGLALHVLASHRWSTVGPLRWTPQARIRVALLSRSTGVSCPNYLASEGHWSDDHPLPCCCSLSGLCLRRASATRATASGVQLHMLHPVRVPPGGSLPRADPLLAQHRDVPTERRNGGRAIGSRRPVFRK